MKGSQENGNDEFVRVSKYEFQQLKSKELNGRIGEFVTDLLDWWTDLALMLVYFAKGSDSNMSEALSWIAQTSENSDVTPPGVPDATQSMIFNLGIASAFILGANLVWRSGLALYPLIQWRNEISSAKEWSTFILAYVVTLASPHNGIYMVESILEESAFGTEPREIDLNECKLSTVIMLSEDFPQLIIQIIYAAIIINDTQASPANAWFISIVITGLHLISQLFFVAMKLWKLPAKITGNAATVATGEA